MPARSAEYQKKLIDNYNRFLENFCEEKTRKQPAMPCYFVSEDYESFHRDAVHLLSVSNRIKAARKKLRGKFNTSHND